MKGFTKKLVSFSFMVFCFLFVLLIDSFDTYASNCTTVFNKNNNKIDYSLYLPSIVRVYSSGYGSITGDSVVRALNYMLGDDALVDTVEPIIGRLRKIEKRKDFFDAVVKFFGSTVSMQEVEEKDIESLVKYMRLPEKLTVNLRDIIRVMREYNSPHGWHTSSGCTGVVVSHNVLLTAAHCVFNRLFIGASLADNRYVEATTSFYPLASMASSKKFFFDVGVIVFPDHTFDGLTPLKVKDPSSGNDKLYGAMGIDTDGTGENKRWGDVVILGKNNVFLSSQEKSSFISAHGNSGGPLMNEKGEIVGIISGVGKDDDTGDIFDLYTSLGLEENYSFLQNIVRNNGIKINGIE